jgi:uroporphyrinogen-III synthase
MSTNTATAEKPTRVKNLLISQSRPADDKSPYHLLATKYSLKLDFRPFIEIQPLPLREFRKQKIVITDYSAIILTSKNAVDAFFGICKEAKLEMPPEQKYFCVTEQTANYLQKYITIRKRKIFTGTKTAADLNEYFLKHKTEKYLYPCSDIRKNDILDFLHKHNIQVQEAVMYQTVQCDLHDLKPHSYDIITFFSPSGVESLLKNFPDFDQGTIRLAAFGVSTAQAVRDAGLRLDIEAPLPNAPSMAGAIELYIKNLLGK